MGQMIKKLVVRKYCNVSLACSLSEAGCIGYYDLYIYFQLNVFFHKFSINAEAVVYSLLLCISSLYNSLTCT